MNTAHVPEHTSPASLWDTFEHFLAAAAVMFGDAKALAARLLLSRKEYKHACAWLWRCEEMLRRLIFIEALKIFPAFAEKTRRSVRPARLPQPAPEKADPDDPADPGSWRVCFALLPSRRGARAGARGKRYPSLRRVIGEFVDPDESRKRALAYTALRRQFFAPPVAAGRAARALTRAPPRQVAPPLEWVPSGPLARRLEAMARAAFARERHAKRLARWLSRNRAHAAHFTRPTRSYYSLQRRPGDHAVADAAHFARVAWAACDTS